MTKSSQYKSKGFKVAPKSASTIASVARSVMSVLLSVAGVKRAADINFAHFIEVILPELGIEFDAISDTSAEIKPEAPAAMIGNKLKMRDSCYKGLCAGIPRDAFTLFHELGHFFLGHERQYTREELGEHKPYEDSEWQANEFAGECLMPLSVIVNKKLDSIQKIQREFGVSGEAAQVRFDKLRKRNMIHA